MLLKEISQKTKYKPEVFLDMDGVLADFFAEYAVLAGLPPGSSYRDVPPAKNDPTLNKMVGTDFFYRLPKFPVADKIVELSVKLFGGYNICSSPLRGDHENSGVQKTRWIRENLPVQPRHIYIESRKEKHAVQPDGTPNILIDDRKDNIIKWEAAGGVGIKFQADEDGLDVITKGMRRAIEIYKGRREKDQLDLTPSLDRGLPVATKPDKEVNESEVIIDRDEINHEAEIKNFINWVYDKENIKGSRPKIIFSNEKEGPDMHHTGWYRDSENLMWVYTGNRNLIDILRTVAHELVHRKQGIQGRIKGASPPGSKLEREADAQAGYLMKLYGAENPEIVE
jgi:5'(3')-deoxyribonucleotidase